MNSICFIGGCSRGAVSLPTGTWEWALVTNPEIIAVNQDKDCVQGTKLSGMTDPDGNKNLHNWAADVWIKPLSDGSFAATLINRDPRHSHPVRISFGAGDTMLFPAGPFSSMLVRDLHARLDLGTYLLQVEVEVSGGLQCNAASAPNTSVKGSSERLEDFEIDPASSIGCGRVVEFLIRVYCVPESAFPSAILCRIACSVACVCRD